MSRPKTTVIAFRSCLLALLAVVCACSGKSTESPSLPAPVATTPVYAPGLGETMSFTQMRHLKLWFAGQAGNWPLADYELDELKEGFDDMVTFHPHHEKVPRPLAEMIQELMLPGLNSVGAAIERKDVMQFTVAYDQLTNGCNGCHAASGLPFNRIVRPVANPYANQQFQP